LNRIALFAAVLMLLAVPALNARPMGKGMGPEMMGRMAEQLKLTDQQIEQLQNLRFQLEKDLIKPESDLKLAKLEMKQIMMQPKIDENAALSKQADIAAIKGNIAKLKLQHIIAAGKILTADQLAQWKKMHRGMGPMGRKGEGRGGPCCDKMMMGGGPGCKMMGDMGGPMGQCGMGQGMMDKQMKMEQKGQDQKHDK
jgi:Spy/CpxP family protein refolding chaperone